MARKPTTVALTYNEIEDRLEEAALTLKRLPVKGGAKGYGSSWPDVVRSRFTAYGFEQARVKVIPNAQEIQRMEDAIDWLRLIGSGVEQRDAQDRRIVWMRAELYPWRVICRHVGLSRATAWRRWLNELLTIEKRLAKDAKAKRRQSESAE